MKFKTMAQMFYYKQATLGIPAQKESLSYYSETAASAIGGSESLREVNGTI
jgi:hypothetical protein